MITLYSHSYRTTGLFTALLISLTACASTQDAMAAQDTQKLVPVEAASAINTDTDNNATTNARGRVTADTEENTAVTALSRVHGNCMKTLR